MNAPLQTIPVGVVIERRKAVSTWVDYVWMPVEVLHGEPSATPWTKLGESTDVATFYAGAALVELHPTETANYRDNLSAGARLWVTLRPTGVEPPYEVAAVTADPHEGESYVSAGDDLVEALPMPASVVAIVDAFVAEHHVDQPFFKRKRDRADPEALARRDIGGDKR